MKRSFTWLKRFILRTIVWFFIISFGSVLLLRWMPVLFTPLMIIRSIEYARDAEANIDLNHSWVSIDKISKPMQLAVIASEDQKFLEHNGFDWEAMQKAWEGNKKGKRIKGASTISQQTAKNVFLWPSRTYLRKGLEAYFTFLIELIWTKERILEVYLNVVEVGKGTYGVQAGASDFYQTDASSLNNRQGAMIAAILPSPRKWNPIRPTPYLVGRQAWIMAQMQNLGQYPFGDN